MSKKKAAASPKTHPLITKALREIAKAPSGQRDMLRVICEKIADEDLDLFDVDLLARMSKNHWELAKKRQSSKPRMRIYVLPHTTGAKARTIIDIVSDDAAFLVDSAVSEVNRHNLLIHLLVHPIIYTDYDPSGKLTYATAERDEKLRRQSHIHIQIKEALSKELFAELKRGLEIAMDDVYIANRDWPEMLAKLKDARDELAKSTNKRSKKDIEKHCAFLDYLYNNNFTLLGYREYEFVEKDGALKSKTIKGASLGLLADDVSPAYINDHQEGLPRNLQKLRRNLPPVSISKTNRLSTVHRRVPMDAIAVKTYDKKGNVVGEKLFIGLFTSVTYSRSVSDVPFLREKVEETIAKSEFIQGSHNRKALRHILEKYPRDELFQIEPDELYKIALDILRLQERQRIALFMRQDPFGRYISCLVYVPKDRFGTSLRKRITAILEEQLHGTCTNFYTTLDDSVFARVMFVININQATPPGYDHDKIEEMLQNVGKTWQEMLTNALAESLSDDERSTELNHKYSEAFPVGYTSQYRAKQAVFDIEKIEEALSTNELALDLYRSDMLKKNELALKVYNLDAPLTLSDVMPILENMGLRAIAELPYEVKPAGENTTIWIHDFLLETSDFAEPINIPDVKDIFERAFTRIWYKKTENDGLNRLVLSARTNWHEITILRAYVRYLKQTNYPHSRPYIQRALTDFPHISRMIVDLFKAYHHPKNEKKSSKLGKECHDKIEQALEKVESLDQDRILRTMATVVEATLRTNYFQRDKDGTTKPYLSLKLDSALVPDLPEPRPFREIFVYSTRVEGIHLRGDKIARGGLRWSDRHEDFRTEVLGLMKAQMVKNAVIVPVGAKGGFVVKTQIRDRAKYREEGIECYKIFIRGLLDITDNRKGTKVIRPKDVVCRDEEDPYLVVAADKGTASFSDIANSLSLEYGHWLGDAFASGGSAGYDHKKMGITARGAWESVMLHFRQLNHNTQTQPFDVVGVGDMGGDVFGNGMLLSEKIRLIGAFNHLHIVCDPDPDTAASFKERKRLFDNVEGWDAYDTKKLSKGGRIYSRSDKTLTLTAEIQKRFDIEKEKVTPIELIRAMLKSRTDLLWFGGIGTYIKAVRESHMDVGDKTNDALRINATEIRAKILGEGANLAMTQLARIEYAEHGGKLNTDFIDNSAGVDSSDHEVNIKILLSEVMRKKDYDMDLKKRNKLLEQMTEEVAAHVLRDNYQQAQAISLAELQAKERLQIQEEFIQDMERDHALSREIEGLPSKEMIEQRLRTGKGMTRPELCILLAYGKIRFTQDLLACDIPDDPQMTDWLMDYFPTPLQKRYKEEILRHRLKREIIATVMSNSLVNRMGPTFIKARMKKTGTQAADIAKAYIIVRDAFDLRALWDSIEALDNKVPAEVQLKAMREISYLADHAITWFLTRSGAKPDLATDILNYGKGIRALRESKIDLPELQLAISQRLQAWKRDGLPEKLAYEIAIMPWLASACDIIRIAMEEKTDILDTGRAYFELGEKFHLDWLRQQARFITSDDHWHAEATSGLLDQLYNCQASLTARIMKDMAGKKTGGKTHVEKWLEQNEHSLRLLNPLFAELRRAGTVDLPMLIIAEQKLRSLAA